MLQAKKIASLEAQIADYKERVNKAVAAYNQLEGIIVPEKQPSGMWGSEEKVAQALVRIIGEAQFYKAQVAVLQEQASRLERLLDMAIGGRKIKKIEGPTDTFGPPPNRY